MKKVFIPFLLVLPMMACSWVELKEDAKAIRIVKPQDVINCEKVGSVVVSLKDKIAGFDRDERKVKDELETLARNTVIDSKIGGDTITSDSPVKDGKQTFAVYKCMQSR